MKDSPFERAKARLREQDEALLRKQRAKYLNVRKKRQEVLIAEDRESYSSFRRISMLLSHRHEMIWLK